MITSGVNKSHIKKHPAVPLISMVNVSKRNSGVSPMREEVRHVTALPKAATTVNHGRYLIGINGIDDDVVGQTA